MPGRSPRSNRRSDSSRLTSQELGRGSGSSTRTASRGRTAPDQMGAKASRVSSLPRPVSTLTHRALVRSAASSSAARLCWWCSLRTPNPEYRESMATAQSRARAERIHPTATQSAVAAIELMTPRVKSLIACFRGMEGVGARLGPRARPRLAGVCRLTPRLHPNADEDMALSWIFSTPTPPVRRPEDPPGVDCG